MCLHGRLCTFVQYLWSWGCQIPGARITQLWAACHGCWEPNLGPPQERLVLLTLSHPPGPTYYHLYALRTISFFPSTYFETHSTVETMPAPVHCGDRDWLLLSQWCAAFPCPPPFLPVLRPWFYSVLVRWRTCHACLPLGVVFHLTKCPSVPSTWRRW